MGFKNNETTAFTRKIALLCLSKRFFFFQYKIQTPLREFIWAKKNWAATTYPLEISKQTNKKQNVDIKVVCLQEIRFILVGYCDISLCRGLSGKKENRFPIHHITTNIPK